MSNTPQQQITDWLEQFSAALTKGDYAAAENAIKLGDAGRKPRGIKAVGDDGQRSCDRRGRRIGRGEQALVRVFQAPQAAQT